MTVEATQDIGVYDVQSESDPDSDPYRVDIDEMTCTCPHFMDFGRASKREPCKHIEAAIYYVATLQFYDA